MGSVRVMVKYILFIFSLITLSLSTLHEVRAEVVYLSEAGVIEMALQQNLGVQIAKVDQQVGQTTVMASKAVFDTLLSLNGDYFIDKKDVPIPVFGDDNTTATWNLSLAKVLPTGTRTRLEWLNRRETTNSPFALISPFFDSTARLAIEQPLLNNYFGFQDRGGVKVAKKEYEASDAAAQRQIREAVFSVLSDYWRWVTDQSIVKVQKKAVEEARHFEEVAQQKEQFGLYESTDVLTAQSSRLDFESRLVLAQLNEENSRSQLLTDLDFNQATAIQSHETIHLKDDNVGLHQALTTALEQRTDYKAAQANLKARKIELALAKNSRWPELDLVASLALNGVDGDYGTALSDLGSTDHPAYFVGGEFSFPLENRLARSETKRASLGKRRALYGLKNLENKIRQDVEVQWRSIRELARIVVIRQRTSKIQRDRLEEEFRKYQMGRSDSDIVTRFQQDYIQAQRVELEALFNYRLAVLGLRLAQNTLIP